MNPNRIVRDISTFSVDSLNREKMLAVQIDTVVEAASICTRFSSPGNFEPEQRMRALATASKSICDVPPSRQPTLCTESGKVITRICQSENVLLESQNAYVLVRSGGILLELTDDSRNWKAQTWTSEIDRGPDADERVVFSPSAVLTLVGATTGYGRVLALTDSRHFIVYSTLRSPYPPNDFPFAERKCGRSIGSKIDPIANVVAACGECSSHFDRWTSPPAALTKPAIGSIVIDPIHRMQPTKRFLLIESLTALGDGPRNCQYWEAVCSTVNQQNIIEAHRDKIQLCFAPEWMLQRWSVAIDGQEPACMEDPIFGLWFGTAPKLWANIRLKDLIA